MWPHGSSSLGPGKQPLVVSQEGSEEKREFKRGERGLRWTGLGVFSFLMPLNRNTQCYKQTLKSEELDFDLSGEISSNASQRWLCL